MASDTNHFKGRESSVSFGPFRLLSTQRLLMKGNKPVHVGSRAFDILIVLLERAGELVTKEELMARVWPNTFVESANLAVHIGALRRILGDGHSGHRYVVNIPGRGYRFVAPATVANDLSSATSDAAPTKRAHNLPAHLTDPIGRADIISQVAGQLMQERLLTIVGPGGIGKTTVARVIAERLIGIFEHGVWLVDLASIADPSLLPTALAAALGLEIGSAAPFDAVTLTLADKRMLIVFDNCEHIIGPAAAFATRILRAAPSVHILATSREPLRSEGERVYRLPPFQTPATTADFDVGKAMSCPAIQLFAARATSTLGEFELTDRDASVVANICRRLDGLPLAIELAAARLDTLGLQGLSKCLNGSLDVLTQGRRTDLPRHQSLRATLDWSYALLTGSEQIVFRRLGVFAGRFTLRDALCVARNGTESVPAMIEILAALVAKSLVVAHHQAGEPEYHLLSTTRAYSLAKLMESGEIETVRRRYAEGGEDIVEWPTSGNKRAALADSGPAQAYDPDEIGCAVGLQTDNATSAAVIAPPAAPHDWQRRKRARAFLECA